MEIICIPPTAASDKLHLGNLYGWMLIDTYKRGREFKGVSVIAPESWNCYTEKKEQHSPKSDHEKEQICLRYKSETDKNIEIARELFLKYAISFDSPTIRDDSRDYQDFITERVEALRNLGIITSSNIRLPPLESILQKCPEINWKPENIWKRLYGSKTLDDSDHMPLFREGYYGITLPENPRQVLGQRFVQSQIPSYIRSKYRRDIDLCIFGNDILTKWFFFVMANTTEKPFKKIGVSGMILGNDGKRMSLYNGGKLITELDEHPDNVRLGFLSQQFGRDFLEPDFSKEERLRRKAVNCKAFLDNCKVSEKNRLSGEIRRVDETASNIVEEIGSLNFSQAHKSYRRFLYETISQKIINLIKTRGIGKDEHSKLTQIFRSLGRIFIPVTTGQKNQ